MADTDTSWKAYLPLITLVLALAGVLWGAAQSYRQLEEIDRRLGKVESAYERDVQWREANAERLARIERDVSFLVKQEDRRTHGRSAE